MATSQQHLLGKRTLVNHKAFCQCGVCTSKRFSSARSLGLTCYITKCAYLRFTTFVLTARGTWDLLIPNFGQHGHFPICSMQVEGAGGLPVHHRDGKGRNHAAQRYYSFPPSTLLQHTASTTANYCPWAQISSSGDCSRHCCWWIVNGHDLKVGSRVWFSNFRLSVYGWQFENSFWFRNGAKLH